LTVDERVIEARFFLGKLTDTGPSSEDSVHYLSAFLSASRSIMNQLLHDYSEKHGLEFTDTDPLNSRTFRNRAHSKGARDALVFIDAFDRAIGRLESNKYYEVLALRRNINVRHGAHPLVHNLTVMTQERINDTDTLTVKTERDAPIAVGPNVFHPVAAEPETGSPKNLSFEDFPGDSVRRICALYLSAIVDEVATLRAER